MDLFRLCSILLQKNDVESELSQTKAKCDAIANEKKDISQLLAMTKATTEMLESERNRQGNEIESMKKVRYCFPYDLMKRLPRVRALS